MEPLDWKEETRKLDQTLSLIRKELEQWEKVLAERKTDIVEARKHFGELTFDPLDLEESAMDFRHHRRELDRQELVYSHAFAARRKLLLLLDAPYFGRIDFQEKGTEAPEAIYIGKATVLDENQEHVLIHDWRAPVSSMFYDYELGAANYETPVGPMEGNIELKRQYLIRFGQLKHMFNTGLHIADSLLQLLLGQNADDKMKSIVTTIQKEQNRIIRENRYRTVIVQGSAGSGKTSAAMQRAAYMLYRHRETWQANDILLLSPNGLFGDYVSNVLPELGEDRLRQMTFQQLLEQALGEAQQVEDPFTQLESLLATDEQDLNTSCRIKAIQWKASLEFVALLETYIESLGTSGMLFRSIGFRSQTLVSVEKLNQLWYEEFQGLTVRKRIENIKIWVEAELKAKRKGYVQTVYKNLIMKPNYIGTDEELLELAKKKVGEHFKLMKKDADQLAFIDFKGLYKQWFESMDQETLGIFEDGEAVRNQTLAGIQGDVLPYEDAVPLMYLRQAFVGVEQHHSVRHVMIDEAQDYSPFQLHMIRTIYPRGGMTLLGDFQQAVLAHTFASGNSLHILQKQFPAESTLVFELTKSYRSTREIVDLSTSIVNRTDIEPFSRNGEKPLVVRVASREHLPVAAVRAIRELQAKGAASIAVICKTAQQSEHAYRDIEKAWSSLTDSVVEYAAYDLELEPGLNLKVKAEKGGFESSLQLNDTDKRKTDGARDAQSEAQQQLDEHEQQLELITKYTQTFRRGIVVIPSYLAKGLEFDGIVVYDASKDEYSLERERRLFYTVCTRALHHLVLLSTGQLTSFIPDASLYSTVEGDES
ncbi:MAG: hypothetical protein K0R67_1456 [Paenibacillus sp.]|jgi:DNA helicase-2/ATP-dependent DNA helicase PcrA|nr:hypothetical protein [Paenibacillus sp.]